MLGWRNVLTSKTWKDTRAHPAAGETHHRIVQEKITSVAHRDGENVPHNFPVSRQCAGACVLVYQCVFWCCDGKTESGYTEHVIRKDAECHRFVFVCYFYTLLTDFKCRVR